MAAYLVHSAFFEFHVDDVHHHHCTVLFTPPRLEWKRNLIYFPGDTQVSHTIMDSVEMQRNRPIRTGSYVVYPLNLASRGRKHSGASILFTARNTVDMVPTLHILIVGVGGID